MDRHTSSINYQVFVLIEQPGRLFILGVGFQQEILALSDIFDLLYIPRPIAYQLDICQINQSFLPLLSFREAQGTFAGVHIT